MNTTTLTMAFDPASLHGAATIAYRYLCDVGAHGDYDLIDELAHSGMVDEANQLFGGPPGRAGLVAHVKGFHRNIGERTIHLETIVGDDSKALAWWRFSGTLCGPWLGQPPTNAPIGATVFSQFLLTDGLISRYRLWLCASFDPPIVLDTSRPELLDPRLHLS